MCRSKSNEIDFRYHNEATAPQIAAQSPSDNNRLTISDAPVFSRTSTVRTNRSDRDGPAVMWRLLRWLGVLRQARVGARSGKRVLPE